MSYVHREPLLMGIARRILATDTEDSRLQLRPTRIVEQSVGVDLAA